VSAANPLMPHLMRISEAFEETPDVRSLRLDFIDSQASHAWQWQAGQFGQFSVFGSGECVLTIANPPTRPGHVQCTFRRMGKVTTALRDLSVGQVVGFRGPYGNCFPVEAWRGRDLVFVGGGIGMAALRSPLLHVLDRREDYGEVLVVNGARTAADMVYKQEMLEWAKADSVKVVCTVDPGGETPGWDGEIGLTPEVFERLAPKANGNVVVTCGPPVMVAFMLAACERLGFAPERVVTTLENRMKCGVGQCGHCNVGRVYVCREGPVFSAAELKALPAEY